jgi:hypothetical protein
MKLAREEGRNALAPKPCLSLLRAGSKSHRALLGWWLMPEILATQEAEIRRIIM